MVSLLVPADVVESADQRRNGFPFRSGSIVLDFVATVAKRDMADRELLTDTDAFVDWIHVAGLPEVTGQMTMSHVRRARDLREAINGLTRARVHGTTPSADDIEVVNIAARSATPAAQLDASATSAVPADSIGASAVIALLAREAVELFTGAHADRIRLCRGHDCSLYFVDRSRVGNRTWCSMSACGVKNSSARYRARNPGRRTARPHPVTPPTHP